MIVYSPKKTFPGDTAGKASRKGLEIFLLTKCSVFNLSQ